MKKPNATRRGNMGEKLACKLMPATRIGIQCLGRDSEEMKTNEDEKRAEKATNSSKEKKKKLSVSGTHHAHAGNPVCEKRPHQRPGALAGKIDKVL